MEWLFAFEKGRQNRKACGNRLAPFGSLGAKFPDGFVTQNGCLFSFVFFIWSQDDQI